MSLNTKFIYIFYQIYPKNYSIFLTYFYLKDIIKLMLFKEITNLNTDNSKWKIMILDDAKKKC